MSASDGSGEDVAFVALARASALASEPLTEETLIERHIQWVKLGANADFGAVYVTGGERGGAKGPWRLAGHDGGDAETLRLLPVMYGQGTSILAGLLRDGREMYERDLLPGSAGDEPIPPELPARALLGVPLRRRDGRVLGAVLVGSTRPQGFSERQALSVRSMAHLLAVALDNGRLTASQQFERERAAESEETLGTVLESVGSGVCVVDLDGTVRMTNKAFNELFGLSDRVVGLAQEEVISGAQNKPAEIEVFLEALRTLRKNPAQVTESEWHIGLNRAVTVQRNAAPLRNLVGEVVGRVEVYTDVTEGRRMYAELLQSEKLRAIGEMSSGVAHDFNNLLASILGQTEVLRPEDQPVATRRAIATIRQAALDGARIVRGMQSYARGAGEAGAGVADLDDTIQLAIEMAKPRWAGAALRGGGSVDLRVQPRLGDPGVLVAMGAQELREVLLNLLFNAADAMPDGGVVDIRSRLSEPTVAEVEVQDTGMGMPDDVRARIFEPFFSTKGARGNGLGLAVAHSMITRHGGEIRVQSHVGEGTTFTIRLPIAPAGSAATGDGNEAAAGASEGAYRLAGLHILAVDDEPGLLALVRQLLERGGATVATAPGGAAAIREIQTSPAKFDAILTDLDMPEVDGWAVVTEARAHAASTGVVMLTGWVGEVPMEDFHARGVDSVLPKPSSRAELETAILAARTRAVARQDSTSAAVASRRILVVDDDPAFGRTLRELLSLHGHAVELASSVNEAEKLLASGDFQVVLADYQLGETTGADLARRVAQMPSPPFFVLLTGYATSVNAPSLMSPGVHAVLPKPCRAAELQAVLASAPHRSMKQAFI